MSATPARHSTPPANANGTGASPSSSQPSRMATGGTRYVVAPIRPALVRDRAYAQVVNATAVGNAPRNTTQPRVDGRAAAVSRTSSGPNGRQATVPITHASQVTCNAGRRASKGFCATTPTA